jgi:hypothetical protein
MHDLVPVDDLLRRVQVAPPTASARCSADVWLLPHLKVQRSMDGLSILHYLSS